MSENNLPVTTAKTLPATTESAAGREFVTMYIEGQLFGIPVLQVQDVLGPQKITRVPLAPKEVAGSLNLRGRIVTAIDVRTRLGLPQRENGTKSMSVVVDLNGEFYSLIVDQVGEVMSLSASDYEKTPATLDERWREISDGVYRLKETLLVVIDVKRLLRLEELVAA
ncbi:MAG TPA: chemotaxis protein CheW [Rhodospirillaceae bacterium]|nr:chemotaxis protein CheW [Rhodospirillaceae bacterium]